MIKKTSETTPVAASVVNQRNNSTTDAYSCDYSNKAFGGTILWTNSSPTSSMSAGTTITLSSDDYDMLEIFYKVAADVDGVLSYKIFKGNNTRLTFGSIGVNAYGYNSMRELTYTSDTSYTAGTAYFQRTNTSNASTDNGRLIPIYVIGYKTGLL